MHTKDLKRKWGWMLCKIVLFCFAVKGVERFCHKQTEGFSMTKITSTLSYEKEWETTPLSPSELEKIKAICMQPFTYLGKGAQCYAFASQDGLFVIKFTRHFRMRLPFWLEHLPLPSFCEPYRLKEIEEKKGKLHREFTSYKIAYEELKEETGLVFLHLNKSSDLKVKLPLVDRLGIVHLVPLDQMEFVLQKRALPCYETIEKWIQQGEEQKVKKAISSLVDLLAFRCKKEIFDKDPNLETNFGFLEGKPIQIDVGRFRKDASRSVFSNYIKEIIQITDSLKRWLEERDPAYAGYLEEQIALLK